MEVEVFSAVHQRLLKSAIDIKSDNDLTILPSTLEAICKVLECQPGDILEYKSDEEVEGV
jgi:DNA-binding Xre family transcriptional regulator